MRQRWLILGGIAAVVAAGYALTGVTQVRPGERAVVRRFGRVLNEQPGPGLWFGLPWGMDRVDRVPIEKVRRVEIGYSAEEDDGGLTPAGQLLTGDHNLVNLRVVVNYTVKEDKEAVVGFAVQEDRIDGLVGRAAETALAEWVAGRTVDDVLIAAKAELPRWLVTHAQERLDGYDVGVRVQDATVTHALPPDQVRPAFDRVTQAQTGVLTAVNEAEQQRLSTLRDEEAKRDDVLRRAAAYARARRLDALEEALAFLHRADQYHQLRHDNPSFLAGIWFDVMDKLYADLKKNERLDLLDHYLAGDEINFTTFPPPLPKK
jgi:membrane protease subunit HflK